MDVLWQQVLQYGIFTLVVLIAWVVTLIATIVCIIGLTIATRRKEFGSFWHPAMWICCILMLVFSLLFQVSV